MSEEHTIQTNVINLGNGVFQIPGITPSLMNVIVEKGYQFIRYVVVDDKVKWQYREGATADGREIWKDITSASGV